jgi:hypothetical protein
MYSLLALLAGVAAKLYDDIEDNNFLQKFHNNTLMEFLKGIHYILFMSLSIEEPLFFLISYLINILHSFGAKESYSKPYEHSLLYSFVLLFFIIDYKKITSLCLFDKLLIISGILMAALEPLIGPVVKNEYSFTKMICRVITMVFQIILCCFIRSNVLKYLTIEFIGYLFISVLVQYYSLRMEKQKIEIEKEEKEVKEEEIKEVKEVKEEEEVKEKEEKEIKEEEVKEKEVKEKEIKEEEVKGEVKEEEKEVKEKEVKEIEEKEIEDKEVKKEK